MAGNETYTAGSLKHYDGTPAVGTGMERDPNIEKIIPGSLNAATVRYELSRMEFPTVGNMTIGQAGTTVYNPRRCDKEVEEVLGEHKYKFTTSPDSPEALRRKVSETESELDKLKMQMAALLAAVSGGNRIAEPAPVQASAPASDGDGGSGLNAYRALQRKAKKLGIDTKQTAAELETAIAEKEAE